MYVYKYIYVYMIPSGVLLDRSCGLELELSFEGLVRAGFVDEVSEYPPASGSNIVMDQNQPNDATIYQNRCSTVLGLTSFDNRETADEIMRIGSERGENVARHANAPKKTNDKSSERGSGLPAVVNSILFGDSCDIYVKCHGGVVFGN